MSKIPITRDYSDAVGPWCERVENRSLLLEKFAFPKIWGGDNKENKASSWSLMRIATNGGSLLRNEATNLEYKSRGKNASPENTRRLAAEAGRCRDLAQTRVGSGLEAQRPAHTLRLLSLLRANFKEGETLHFVAARLEGRLAINLADGLIQNAGISLDRIFGLPLIPGSAIKGAARHAALDELAQKNDPATLALFARVLGTADNDYTNGELENYAGLRRQTGLPENLKGAVSFLQATPLNDAKIVVDLTNVHYPDYYRTGNQAQQSSERPQPNPFPAVERGAEFAFPIVLNGLDTDTDLLRAAARWLETALTRRGLGAKTAAGYGWFSKCDNNRLPGLFAAQEREEQELLEKKRKARETEQQRLKEEEEKRRRGEDERKKRLERAEFDKLTPAGQLAAIAADNGQFRQFMEKKFPALLPAEKVEIVRWFASDDGRPRWLEIKEAAGKGKRPWPQIVPQIHAAKKSAGLTLP